MRGAQRFLLAGLFALSACGFSPIYGSHTASQTPTAHALSSVYIDNIPDENGQNLRNKLIDRMYFEGRPEHPTARLSIVLDSSEADLGIQKDATASLRQLSLGAHYKLLDEDGGKLVDNYAHSIVIYSKLDAQYGTVASQRDAFNRALTEISEQIVNRLSLFYAETPPKPATKTFMSPDKSWTLSPNDLGDEEPGVPQTLPSTAPNESAPSDSASLPHMLQVPDGY